MAVLVTGGAGFIGSHVCRLLVSQGRDVVVLDDFSSGHRKNLAGVPCRIVDGSILDDADLNEAFQGVEEVVHLAAMVSVPLSLENPLRAHEMNATGSLRVLQAAKNFEVRRFVQASTCAVYGNEADLPCRETAAPAPSSPYAAAKLAAEAYAQTYTQCFGLSTASLRFFNVFGPRQDPSSPYSGVLSLFLSKALAGQPLTVYGDGEQTRDFIAAQDVARAIGIALDARPESLIFNVASGVSISLNEALRAIQDLIGAKILVNHQAERHGDIRHSSADITRTQRELGFKDSVTFRDGLRTTLESLSEAPEFASTLSSKP